MSKEKKMLLVSAILMLIYFVFEIVYMFTTKTYKTDPLIVIILEIILLSVALIGSISFIYFSITKKDLSKFKGLIIFFSIFFFIMNIVSGILGFMVSYKLKSTKREIPKLEIEYSYKWYIYFIIFVLDVIGLIIIPDYINKNLYRYGLIPFVFLLNIFIFRKELKRDIKYFFKYFKEYNQVVFKIYGIALVLIFILSFSIRLTTGINNPTNQTDIMAALDIMPLYIILQALIVGPITEELMFRGMIRKLIDNKWLFIIISGLVFGVLHVIDDFKTYQELLYILVYGGLGAAFAYTYYKTNNICTNIFMHILQNSLAIIAILLTKII